MKRLVGLLVTGLILVGCGTSEDMSNDDRYQYCVDHGGSFKYDGPGEFSCSNPETEDSYE